MRIIQLTPGTGHFYCGNCLRDHALTTALRRLGHDALMVPLYLPFHLEESPLPRPEPVYMGGINLYLQQRMPWLHRLPRWISERLDSPRLLRWSSTKGDMTDAARHADMTLSMLRGEEGRQRWELARLLDHLRSLPHPDVVGLCNVLLAGMADPLKKALAKPIVCTLHGEDAFLDSLPETVRQKAWSELKEKAKSIDAFIAVSRYYGDVMTERLSLDPARVHVVYNGIDVSNFPAGVRPDVNGPPVIGFLARLCEQKGLGTLVDAFMRIASVPGLEAVQLRAAGVMLKPDRAYVETLRRRLSGAHLSDRVEFLPNLDREAKLRFLQSINVLSVPATYGEAFGLYLIEAMAAGVPVVQPDHAAFPEILASTGGGVLCRSNDAASLASTIASLLRDPATAQALGRRGRQSVLERFTADSMARGVAEVCMMTMWKHGAMPPDH